jgi:hypothetical protein
VSISAGTSAPVPFDAAELVEDGRCEENRVAATVPVDGRDDGAMGRLERRDEAPDHARIDRLVAEGDHGRLGPRGERVEPRAERRRLAVGVAGVVRHPHGQPPERRRDGLALPACDDYDVIEAGGHDPLDRHPHEGPPVAERERELLAAHAGRRPGCEDDRGDHPLSDPGRAMRSPDASR